MTPRTPEAIAQWAEQHDADKKPAGAAGHLTPEQKHQIRAAYLATGGNVTYTELGLRCASIIGRAVNRETVGACMKGPEYEQLRKQFDSEIKATAIERLKAGIIPAADAWTKAVSVAGEKGDHKPAKDLLMHTQVIEPLDDDGRARGPLVLVLAAGSSPGNPRWHHDGGTVDREGRDELLAKHKGNLVQIGIDASDVKIVNPPAPLYRDPVTGNTYTPEQLAELKQDTLTIGVQLPGTGTTPD